MLPLPDLVHAVWKRDVDAVKGMLDVKWDRIKRRRLAEVSSASLYGWNRPCCPCGESLDMCLDPNRSSKNKKESEKSFKILDMVLESILTTGLVTANSFWSACASLLANIGAQPNWPRVVQICCQRGVPFVGQSAKCFLSHLAKHDYVDVLKVFVENKNLITTLSMCELCSHYFVSLEFWEVLLQNKDTEFWTTVVMFTNGQTTLYILLFHLAAHKQCVDVLRLFIQHGLPPTDHAVLIGFVLLDQQANFPQEYFDMLLDHSSPESKLHCNVSLSFWAHDYHYLQPTRPAVIQQLREHPVKKLKSWSKRMHPGHTLRGDDCSLCYDIYKAGQKIVKLPCSHVFHLECMLDCVPMKQDTCPYCRTRYI